MVETAPNSVPENNRDSERPDMSTRFGAWAYDSCLLIALFIPVLIFLIVHWYITYWMPVCCGQSPEELAVAWFVVICTGAGLAFHRVYRLVVTGQTPGMRRTGIEIVRIDNGRRMSYPKAFLRTILPPAVAVLGFTAATFVGLENPLWGALLWLIFPISALRNPENRGWHDRIASAVVVTKRIP